MEFGGSDWGVWLFLAPFILCLVGLLVFGLFIFIRGLFRFFGSQKYDYQGEWGTREISREEAIEIALAGLPKPEENKEFTYEQARGFAIRGLQNSIEFHEQGNLWGVTFLAIDFEELLAKNKNLEGEYLGTANTFWDCWADAIQHYWHHYPSIRAKDWPRLAEELTRNIKNHEPVTNPLILRPDSKPPD